MATAGVFVAACAAAVSAAPLRVVRGDVRVACVMTVGGSFQATTTAISGSVPGELSVDLRTLDAGLSLRSDHMRNTYLEVEKGTGFDRAVLSDIRLAEGSPEAVEGRVSFTGALLLHGTSRPVSGRAQIRRMPSGVHVEATFPLTITDYGIAKPQYLGIGIKNIVQVKIAFDLAP